jgi:hypothetical protein
MAALFVVQVIVVVLAVVEVAIAEITGGFSTFTVVEAVEVLLEVSVESAKRVVVPFGALAVFQDTE